MGISSCNNTNRSHISAYNCVRSLYSGLTYGDGYWLIRRYLRCLRPFSLSCHLEYCRRGVTLAAITLEEDAKNIFAAVSLNLQEKGVGLTALIAIARRNFTAFAMATLGEGVIFALLVNLVDTS